MNSHIEKKINFEGDYWRNEKADKMFFDALKEMAGGTAIYDVTITGCDLNDGRERHIIRAHVNESTHTITITKDTN